MTDNTPHGIQLKFQGSKIGYRIFPSRSAQRRAWAHMARISQLDYVVKVSFPLKPSI